MDYATLEEAERAVLRVLEQRYQGDHVRGPVVSECAQAIRDLKRPKGEIGLAQATIYITGDDQEVKAL
jgi:hypothetical protein